MRQLVVVLGCDVRESGGIGPENIARCNQAVAGASRKAVFALPAGGHVRRADGRFATLGVVQYDYLCFFIGPEQTHGVNRRDVDVWGTVGELEWIARILRQERIATNVVIVSSWYHLLRLRMIWRWGCAGRATASSTRFVGSRAGVNISLLALEPIKIVGYAIRLLLGSYAPKFLKR